MKLTRLQTKVLEQVVTRHIRGEHGISIDPGVAARLQAKGLITIVGRQRVRLCDTSSYYPVTIVVCTQAGVELAIAMKLGGPVLAL